MAKVAGTGRKNKEKQENRKLVLRKQEAPDKPEVSFAIKLSEEIFEKGWEISFFMYLY